MNKLFLKAISVALLALFTSTTSNAALVTDFTGIEMTVSLSIIDDGDLGTGNFTASLSGSDTALIGGAHEFSVYIGAPGLYSYSSGYVYIDVMTDGKIVAYGSEPESNTGVGNTDLGPYSFSLSFSFTDPGIEVLNYSKGNSMVRGSHEVAGNDPIVWTFASEHDNSYGELMTFIGSNYADFAPYIDITEAEITVVPAPAAAWLFLSALFGMVGLKQQARLQKPLHTN